MIRTLLATLVSPFVFGAILVAAALALSFTERFGRGARRALVALVAVGWLLGTWPVADALIRPLERPYSLANPGTLPPTEPAPAWVVVLGGFYYWHPDLPPGAWVHNTTLHRVVEGVRLHGLLPGSRLLLFAGPGNGPAVGPDPSTYGRVAEMLGASPAAMVHRVGAPNTAGEVLQAAELIGPGEPFYLVTSASHLTRALYLFRRQGLNPIPAPAQAYTWTRLEGDRRRVTLPSFFPSVESYEKADRAVHEYVGLLWARLTYPASPSGRTPNAPPPSPPAPTSW